MNAKLIKLREFEALVNRWNCSIVKTKKDWAVYDDVDGMWVSGFATVSGREVKMPYVNLFEKKIREKRSTSKRRLEPNE